MRYAGKSIEFVCRSAVSSHPTESVSQPHSGIFIFLLLLMLLEGCSWFEDKRIVIEPEPIDIKERWRALAYFVKQHFETDKTVEEIAFMLYYAAYKLETADSSGGTTAWDEPGEPDRRGKIELEKNYLPDKTNIKSMGSFPGRAKDGFCPRL